MTTTEKFIPPEKTIAPFKELETCPHCGAPLNSRHALRQHLTLRVCQGGSGELDESRDHIADQTNPIERD